MIGNFGKWLCMALMVLAFAGQGYAESPGDQTLSPYFYIENGDPLVDRFPLKKTEVVVGINGVIADVTVTQQYVNDGIRPINARYIFPASTRAAVHGMTMKIGDKLIRAKIKEREAAQQEFQQAQKEGKSASLLNQQRPNVFSMNLTNILPKDVVEIELRYTELLIPTSNIYQFVYPTVVGPRYSSQKEAEAPETDQWVKNPYLKAGEEAKSAFHMAVQISTGLAIQEVTCPSHETETIWESDSMVKIMLADGAPFGGNRDFILNYRLAGQKIQTGLLLYEGREENFFLLMVQPPERVQPADIPPREYIFVVDVSGSMRGFPLNTAKTLLKQLIGQLKETEKFNVILFAGGSQVMAPASVQANTTNIDKALRLLDNEQGCGGTELLAGLERGFALPRDEAFSRTVLVITDGFIEAEKKVFEQIQANLNRTNVFSFGIGTSVNRYLIEGMAKAGQGEPFVVTTPEEAPVAAKRFLEYVQAPVLTNIAVAYEGFDAYDVEPIRIPDLFAQRPLVVFGKYHGRPGGVVSLRGMGGAGAFERIFNVAESRPADQNRALRYLWARTRIARLSDARFRGNPEADTKAQVTSLGLTYNLLTQNTAFIAVTEEIRNTLEPVQGVDQPLPLPQHVSNLAVGGGVANVPEPELMLVLGAMLLLVLRNSLKIYQNRPGRGTACK